MNWGHRFEELDLGSIDALSGIWMLTGLVVLLPVAEVPL